MENWRKSQNKIKRNKHIVKSSKSNMKEINETKYHETSGK